MGGALTVKRLMLAYVMILCLVLLGSWAEEKTASALYPIRENGLWGYMNRAGEVVIEPQWAYAGAFSGNTAIVGLNAHRNTGISVREMDDGLINKNGEYLIEPGQHFAIEERTDVYRIIGPAGEGFFDKVSGSFISPDADFQYVMLWNGDGSGPIAAENKDGLTGYLDRITGEVVIPFRYTGDSDEEPFLDGYAKPADEWIVVDAAGHRLAMGTHFHLIDTQGNEITFENGMTPESRVFNGIFIYSMVLPDTEGYTVSEADEGLDEQEEWDEAEESEEEEGWYLADGEQIVFPLYHLNPITNETEEFIGWEEWWNDDDWSPVGLGLARIDGTLITEPDPGLWKIWKPDTDGMLCIVKDSEDDGWSLCGHMDMEGNILVKPRYRIDLGGAEPHYSFFNGYAVIEDVEEAYPYDSRWVVIDHAGNEIFTASAQTEGGERLSLGNVLGNGLLWYATWGVEKEETGNGHWQYKRVNQRYGLMRITDGQVTCLTEPVFEGHSSKRVYDPYDIREENFVKGLHPVKQDGLWGYIDENAQWVISPQYDKAASFSDDLALVEKDGKLMYIDHGGAVVWEER